MLKKGERPCFIQKALYTAMQLLSAFVHVFAKILNSMIYVCDWLVSSWGATDPFSLLVLIIQK